MAAVESFPVCGTCTKWLEPDGKNVGDPGKCHLRIMGGIFGLNQKGQPQCTSFWAPVGRSESGCYDHSALVAEREDAARKLLAAEIAKVMLGQ